MKKILLLLIFFSGSLYAQPPIAQPNDLGLCDQNNDGFEAFDLTSTVSEILNGLEPFLYTELFYLSESDAQNETNPIANPTPFINAVNPQTIYVRVAENANPSNFEITEFDLIVNPQLNIIQPDDLIVYESPFDASAIFDLSSQTTILINGLSSALVTYFTTEVDAFANTAAIANTTAFENSSNPQTIYCRVEDLETGCYSITNFDLIVMEENIVFIPDANFKAKLLSANTTNQIAMNLQFQYFKIDANNDGEIQVSEASEVFLLNINNSFLPNPNAILTISGIESFVNLKELNASLNSISLFNYNLPLLEKLYFTANNLTTVDLTGTPQLIEINLDQNDVSSLDVSVCENLVSLGCDYNFLSSLDISMLSNLNSLSVRYNQLTSLDLSQSETLTSLQLAGNYFLPVINNLVNLESLNCQDMGLSNLDFSSNVNLITLVLNENNFTEIILPPLANLTTFLCSEMPSLVSLNVNLAPSLNFFQCINNPSLQSIFMKNGVQSFQLDWAENFNLQYVCVDDLIVNNIITYLNQIQLTNVNVNSFCSFTPGGNYNTITGNVRLDNDNNGCNETDYSIPFFRLAVDLNAMATNSSVFSNNSGVYNLYTSTEGVYTLTPVLENPSYFSVSPQPGTAIINEIDNSSTTLDFCVTSNGIHPDLEVVIAPVTPARPGFVAEYLIVYKNKGNQVMSEVNGLSFTYNPNVMQFVSSTASPSQMSSGTLQWNYANLMPFESRRINVVMQINPPTDPENPVNIDDELVFTSTILPFDGDDVVQDNTFVFNQTVIGAYDPNDITCLQGDVVSPSEIGNYLHYLIRFENTGNAPAENVVVKVEIDPAQFDINSLQMLSTSHNADIRMNGNKLEFIFQNIQLDSGGHGNILLKMRSNEVLEVGDMVEKKANIYFDYNFPIETNEAETLFQALNVVNPVLDNLISIYPNPAKDIVNITIKDSSTIKTIELYDIQGRLLQTQVVNNIASELNLSSRANGMYFIKINTDKGSKVEKLVKE